MKPQVKTLIAATVLLIMGPTAYAQTYTPGQNQNGVGSEGGAGFYTRKPTSEPETSTSSNSTDDNQEQSTAPTSQDYLSVLQNGLSNIQQNTNAQLQNMQAVHNQVQQEIAIRSAQSNAAANQRQNTPAPYEPPPAPAYVPPPHPIASQHLANNNIGAVASVPQCVASFYNSNMYGWFTFKDTCSFPITIAAELRNGAGTEGGLSTVYPNNSSTSDNGVTGQSANEVNQGGGFIYAACPQGYSPYDSQTNQLWGKNTASYYCKPGNVP